MANWFNNPFTFAACLGVFLLVEIVAWAVMKSALTTIERRFQLSSTSAAFMSTFSQAGTLAVLLFVSFFGSRYHRPRVIAMGSVLLILGYILIILPQFLDEPYQFTDISSSSSSSTNSTLQHFTCKSNTSVRECDEDEVVTTQDSSSFYVFLVVGTLICGLGGSPVSPLGMSYVDDHVSKENSALYIGLLTTIALIGQVLGFVLGSVILQIWVDFMTTDVAELNITPRNPAWVGAWWLGIAICTVLMALISIPFWFFPKTMNTAAKKQTDEDQKLLQENRRAENGDQKLSTKQSGFRELGCAFRRLMTNKFFLLIAVDWSLNGFSSAGFATFSIKYFEVAFGKSASEASFLMGTIPVGLLIVGTVIGSLAIKIWKLECVGSVRIVILSRLVTLLVCVVMLFVGCSTIDVAGVTTAYPQYISAGDGENIARLRDECNARCDCPDQFSPVCGAGGLTYVSPCHAGCSDTTVDPVSETVLNYTSCSCVGSNDVTSYVSLGACMTSKCEELAWVVISLCSAAYFFGGVASTSNFTIFLRVVDPDDKAFAIGIVSFWMRIFGWIPGPLVFGLFIDSSCLMWTQQPCGGNRYCSIYDLDKYRTYFFSLLMCSSIAMLVPLVAYHVMMSSKVKREISKEGCDEKSALKPSTSNHDVPNTVRDAKETVL